MRKRGAPLTKRRSSCASVWRRDPCSPMTCMLPRKKPASPWQRFRRAKPLAGIQARRRRLEAVPSKEWPWEWYRSEVAEGQSPCASLSLSSDEHLEHLEHLHEKSTTCEDVSRCSQEHLDAAQQHTKNQPLALDALDAHQGTVPPTPVFTSLTASGLWCATCQSNVNFRTLRQLDGAEVYLCITCNTEVGQKRKQHHRRAMACLHPMTSRALRSHHRDNLVVGDGTGLVDVALSGEPAAQSARTDPAAAMPDNVEDF